MTRVTLLFCITVMSLLAGCVTTQTQPENNARVKSSAAPVRPSTGSSEKRIENVDGTVSLVSIKNPLQEKGRLYLNGQFSYACMTELMYAAKSGATRLREKVDRECRQEYLAHQAKLKQAGVLHDAPILLLAANATAAYWQSLVEKNIAALRGINRFTVRFLKFANVNAAGKISVRPGFNEAKTSDYVKMASVPAEVPIMLDDASGQEKHLIGIGDWVACEAIWEFLSTAKYPTSHNNDSQYEVQFKTTQIECREASPVKK